MDDGTGLLACTLWVNTEAEWATRELPALGDLVDVGGRLSEFQERRQLMVTRFATVQDPNMEAFRWLEVLATHRDVLAVPFQLPVNTV